jgi:hypothetical protein
VRRLAALLAIGLALALPAAAGADANPCPAQATSEWQGESRFRQVTVTGGYEGTVLRPHDGRKHPAVVVMHGRGGSQCGLWWAARFLAGHGYVALVLTHDGDLAGHQQAVRDGISFLRSRANPYRRFTKRSRLGAVGHSQGSNAVMLAQGDDRRIDAIVALDSLKRTARGDRAAAVGCLNPRDPVAPRVPALGLAMDLPCADRPNFAPPDLKLTGFEAWRAAGLPTLTAVLAGFAHESFTARGTEAQQRLVARYLKRWLKRYLRRDRDALDSILTDTAPLSVRFRSAAFIPGKIDCGDLRRC